MLLSNKIILCSVLLFIVIIELAVDYESMFSADTGSSKDVIYRAASNVDKMFLRDSPAKYANIFKNNVSFYIF